MVSVAEQFSNLRNTLGSILGIFTLLRWMRTLIAKITGRPPPADATALTPSAFASFQGLSSPPSPSNPNGVPTPSRKPFVIFLLAVFGLPYLMTKLIRSLAKSAEEERQQQQRNQPFGLVLGPDGQPLPDQGYPPQRQPIDASKLDFCRVLYDYPPSSSPPPPGSEGIDLTVKKGDPVAVLSKTDPMGNQSEWWRCRARDGRVGYLPGVYLEIVQRRPPAANRQITAKGESRASTMSGSGGDGSRANSLKVEGAKVLLPAAKKVGDGEKGPDNGIGPESFQRGGYYS